MKEAVGVDERVKQAGLLYERAVFSGEAWPLAEADRQLDAAEAHLAVARPVLHTRFLLASQAFWPGGYASGAGGSRRALDGKATGRLAASPRKRLIVAMRSGRSGFAADWAGIFRPSSG
jgi:hypothetical protein